MLREFLCPSVSLKIPQNSGVCVSVRVSLCEGQRLMQAVKRTVIIRKKHDRFCPSRQRTLFQSVKKSLFLKKTTISDRKQPVSELLNIKVLP